MATLQAGTLMMLLRQRFDIFFLPPIFRLITRFDEYYFAAD